MFDNNVCGAYVYRYNIMAGNNVDPLTILVGIIIAVILVAFVLIPISSAIFDYGDKEISEDSEFRESYEQSKDLTNFIIAMVTPGAPEFFLLIISVLSIVGVIVGYKIIR